MIRTTRIALSAVGIALLAAGALTACASPIGGDEGVPTGSPVPDSGDVAQIEIEAAWLDGGRVIGLITQGSSTCVPTAGDVSFADGVIDVELVDPEADTPCTRDLVPRVTLVGTPTGVDPTQDIDIRVTGENYAGDAGLGGVEGLSLESETDFLPSAGWAGDTGQFVILTYGSSTCVPVVESVDVPSGEEVTVTFMTPPADQICTMDMVPRGVIAQVDTLAVDGEVFAVLQGAEFEDVRVLILGSV